MDFLEPIADFMMIMDNTIKHDDVVVMVNGESSFTQGFIENASLENGMKVSGATVGLNRGLTPTMPMYVSLRLKGWFTFEYICGATSSKYRALCSYTT